jgi:cytochrome b561
MTRMSNKYDTVSQVFHWLTVCLVSVMLLTGFGRDLFDFSSRDTVMMVHKGFGLTILALTLLRILWRAIKDAPPLQMPLAQRCAAHGTHALIYAVLIVLPLTGWAMASYFGKPLSYFGLFDVFPITEKNRGEGITTKEVHEFLAFALSGLIALHILAAFFHHFIKKDGVINRMLPNRK